MKRAKYLLSNITLINVLLAAAVIFFADYMVLPFFDMGVRFTPPPASKTDSQDPGATEKPAEAKTPSPSDYMIVAEQNVFHPERKIPAATAEAQPLPKPEFVLYGTLMSGDVKVAYMEDKKSPQSTPGREKRQTSLRIGDTMSGFTLREITKDQVVMMRGEEKMVVSLEDPKTRSAVAMAPAPPPGATQQPPPAAGRAGATTAQPAAPVRRPPSPQTQPNTQIQQPPSQQPNQQDLPPLPGGRQRRGFWGGSSTYK